MNTKNGLTDRQQKVVDYIIEGKSHPEIVELLNAEGDPIVDATLKSDINGPRGIRAKLGLKGVEGEEFRQALERKVRRQGISLPWYFWLATGVFLSSLVFWALNNLTVGPVPTPTPTVAPQPTLTATPRPTSTLGPTLTPEPINTATSDIGAGAPPIPTITQPP